MDKNNAYCPICNIEMAIGQDYFMYNCNCYNNRKFNYILLWCDKCEKFTQRRGLVNNKCNRCAVVLQHKVMKENDYEAYCKRQSNATVKANEKMKAQGKGVWNNETHILMEQTKLANGTSLSNPQFREKIGCNGGLWGTKLTDKEKEKFYQKLLNSGFSRPNSFIYSSPNCELHPNEDKQYYDKKVHNYVCWSCFKEMFHNKDNKNVLFDNILTVFPDAFVQNTFRTQDSENWSGIKNAFEQNLVEKGIKWFVYIKFYNKEDDIRPLVVGKSGSLLVNNSGSDLSFSTDISSGPARVFLSETNQTWDKTTVLIIPQNDEKSAFIYELNIAKEFNLFES